MKPEKPRNRRNVIAAVVITFIIVVASVIGVMQLQPTFSPSTSDTQTIMDLAGNNVTLPREIHRVAVGRPILVEVMMMLNAEDKLVGFSDANSLPWMRKVFPGIVDVNKTFTYSDVIIESLIQEHPDVVFTAVGDKTTDPIIAAGIPCVQISKTTEEDYKKSILLIGQILGPDAYSIATKYVQYFQEKIDFVENRTANVTSNQTRSVLFLGSAVPNLNIYSVEALMSTYIERAGGVNCAVKNLGATSGQGTISAEDFIAYNPDIVLANTTPEDYATLLADTRLQHVTAMANNQTSITPRGVWGTIGGGVGVVEMPLIQLWLAKEIQPSLFEDLNLSAEVQYFFGNFFHYQLTDDDAYRIINAMPPA